MMLPGSTISPPNFLTPSRRPALSRPLRDEPPAFLCAILYLLRLPRRLGLRACLRLGRPAGARAGRSARSALGADLGDLQHSLMLAMTVLAPVILPPLFLEDDDLVGATVLDEGRAHRGAGEERRAGRDIGAIADQQDRKSTRLNSSHRTYSR